MADSALADSQTIALTAFVFHPPTEDPSSVERAVRAAAPIDLLVTVRTVAVEPDDHRARNAAIGSTRGSYLAIVEAEQWRDDRWLSSALDVLRRDPTAAVVSVRPRGAADDRTIDIDPAAFVARRAAWEAIGGYDPSVASQAQGLSLGWRCWLLGWSTSSVDTPARAVREPAPADLDHLCRTLLRAPSVSEDGGEGHLSRAHLQATRRRPDGEVAALFTEAKARVPGLEEALVRNGAERLLGSRRRVVVATADTLAPTMAGPGIRAWRIAGALADEHDVALVTTGTCDLTAERFTVEHVDDDRFREVLDGADVLIFQGWILTGRPWISESDLVVVADVYDPMHLEQLEQGREAPPDGGRWAAIEGATETLNQQLRRGDYFLCASPKQRDLWLGQLAALGRINQVLYDEDNSFTRRLRIVPFGVEDRPPVAERRAIRDAHEVIDDDDPVVLWGGGIYNWFDPLTLIRAIDVVRHAHPGVRLYFLGTAHPNPEIPEMRMAVAARRLAADLGIAGTHVIFNDGWVPFEDRASYLLDADLAVSIHQAHIETEFSFRTRVLDYLWSGLPIVATSGDSFEPLIEEHRLGVTVAPGDVDGLAAAITSVLDDPVERAEMSRRSQALAARHRWSDVLQPILEICRAPQRAPDAACPATALDLPRDPSRSGLRGDLDLFRGYLREGGIGLAVRRARSRLRRLRNAGG